MEQFLLMDKQEQGKHILWKVLKYLIFKGKYDNVDERGIIPRAFEHIFRVIDGTPDI